MTIRRDRLQGAMAGRLGRRGVSDIERGTIVVLPSITYPADELKKISGIQYYEERLLCILLLLRRPRLHIVYLTSHPIDDAIIDYYLSFVADARSARERLVLIPVGDTTPRALSEKLVEQPEVLSRIRDAIPDRKEAYLFPFNVTRLEAEISGAVGIPLYGPLPSQIGLGSKSGSRRVARVAGVPVLEGSEDLYSMEEVEQGIASILERRPGCKAVVVKLNNGFSGQGNVIVPLDGLRSPLYESSAVFCAEEESWPSFAAKLGRDGGVVEELVRTPGTASPSVQMRIFGDGSYEIVSTHDQMLGGPDDQVYLGCRFPARAEYRTAIQAYGLGIARELAAHGVVGSFGIDFIVVPDGSAYLAEINLRLGGTTHPFLMARFATEGVYDVVSGELLVGEREKTYVGTDNIKSDRYVGIEPQDLIAAVREAGLAFDPMTCNGVTLHLLGALKEHGKVGATCIADDAAAADALHLGLIQLLDRLAESRAGRLSDGGPGAA